jgi:hypothetical protein
MVDRLKQFLVDLKALRRDIKAEKVKQIAKRALRTRAEELGARWFEDLSPLISGQLELGSGVLGKYDDAFHRLIALSSPNNLKKSYVDALDTVIRPFRDEIVIPAQTRGVTSSSLALLNSIVAGLPDPDENEYLQEAVLCAQRRSFRAAVVLGWCAAIDRIHRRIDSIGVAKFNVASVQMHGQSTGRFKRFSSPQNITSLGELREVFDSVVLWVIEGMGMIDLNQHTRLRSCFDMRCQCAHPGEVGVTEYNLMSFFSDLDQIVFRNPMFTV